MGTKLNSFFEHQKSGSILKFILVSLIFGLAYTQDPIYNSVENQNTKFLHGLANAGYAFLNEDWVANTIDPLPAFTWLVQTTYKYIHPEYMFYVYYFCLFGIYVYSMFAIVDYVFNFNKSQLKYLVYFAAFIVIHTVHLKIFEFDTGIDLHYGVALQYILGPVFQPSTFGVLLVCSIYYALDCKYYLAVCLTAISATFHPAYLVSAGILTFSYQITILVREKNILKAILVGLLSLALILPVYSYMSLTFTPTTPEIWHQAEDFIVRLRVPHHSLPQVWLKQDGYKSYIQALLVIIALWIVRKTNLFLILLIPFVLTVASTIVQLIIDSDTIAFIAPWRMSIFLVPISSSIILGKIVFSAFDKYQVSIAKYQQRITRLSIAIISIIVIAGTVDQILSFGYGKTSNQMMDFVKEQRQSGQTYLVPPDLESMKKFRLRTGVPIFINDKTHPYKDTEVLEWIDRLGQAREFYLMGDKPNGMATLRSCQLLDNLAAKYSLTHLVLYKEQRNLKCDQPNGMATLSLKPVFNNKSYQVLQIEKSPS